MGQQQQQQLPHHQQPHTLPPNRHQSHREQLQQQQQQQQQPYHYQQQRWSGSPRHQPPEQSIRHFQHEEATRQHTLSVPSSVALSSAHAGSAGMSGNISNRITEASTAAQLKFA